MVAIALLILSASLVMVDLTGAFAFRQRLQFFADQIALEAATHPSQDIEQLSQGLGQEIRVPLNSSSIEVQGGQASVMLCAVSTPAIVVPLVPQASEFCVSSNAR